MKKIEVMSVSAYVTQGSRTGSSREDQAKSNECLSSLEMAIRNHFKNGVCTPETQRRIQGSM